MNEKYNHRLAQTKPGMGSTHLTTYPRYGLTARTLHEEPFSPALGKENLQQEGRLFKGH